MSRSTPAHEGDLEGEEPLLGEFELQSLAREGVDQRAEDSEDEGAPNRTRSTAAQDPFQPFDDLPDEQQNILTARAVVIGILCGALVNASNIYLGLKSGWSSGASIFASIVGFTTLKSLAQHANRLPFLSGAFGPRENNIVQTAATAAGGMSDVFVSAIPAMYQLGLLDSPARDFWKLVTISGIGGAFGFFFATPLRKFFIIHVARELNLVFPGSLATATTIRSLHAAGGDASLAARAKMVALGIAFAFAVVVRVVSQYAIGLLWDWHPFTWLYLLTGFKWTLALESWSWFLEWTPAFIGTGLIVPANVAVSFLCGSILAWGILGPLAVHQGWAFGQELMPDDPVWNGLVSYASLGPDFTSASHPSPRYLLLWPGIVCMVVVAFIELACQWRVFYLSGVVVYRSLYSLLARKPHYSHVEKDHELIPDTASPSEQVPLYIWLPGLIGVMVLTCIVMSLQFAMPVAEICLALFLTFFFSFLAIQSTGVSNITPLTGASKASQVVLGSVTRGPSWPVPKAQLLNLLGGSLAASGASQATELIGDFRVGFLLRTSPLKQWLAQGLGTLAAIFIAPTTFVLFAAAYPCINEAGDTNSGAAARAANSTSACPFQAPSAAAWRAVAVAVTQPTTPIPHVSWVLSGWLAITAAAVTLAKNFLWTGKRAWIRAWCPNMMILGLAFVLPATVYGTAMVIGVAIAGVWTRRNPESFEKYSVAVAAGLMAGEGIGGVLNAVLAVLGLSGDEFGTTFGCPAGQC